MEQKVLKLTTRKAGGSASAQAKKYSIGLPTRWIKELGLGRDSLVDVTLDEDGIVIRKRLPYEYDAFLEYAVGNSHLVRQYRYYDGSVLCTEIAADFTVRQVAVRNHVPELDRQAFGVNSRPTWVDFLNFLEDRCVPRTRVHVEAYLDKIQVPEYDPVAIVEKTQGRMMEDNQWLEIV